jgi:hypothetical protein
MTTASGALSSASHVCVRCHAVLTTPFCVVCGADAAGASLPLQHESPEAVALMGRINLGAGGAPGFWTFTHGAPVLGLLYWLFWLPLPPVSFGIAIFLLFNGNRVALQRRRYRDPAEFHAVERAWAVAGVVLLVPTLFVALIWFATIVSWLVKSGAMK